MVDYEKLETEAWFNYRTDKLCSIAASMATMAFNKFFKNEVDKFYYNHCSRKDPLFEKHYQPYRDAQYKGAMFDARCFNIPKDEVANLIYWRQLDATRNSIQMVGQTNFSHKELQNKSCNMIQDMLHEQKGINWNDYPTYLKRGSCCIKKEVTTTCAEMDDEENVEKWAVERPHWEIDLDIPIFKNENRMYINDKILYYDEAMNYAYVY